MSDAFHDPPRWKDRTDQAERAERSAGHAVRCVLATPLRSAPPLSRVAARIRTSHPPMRRAWVVFTAALIVGLATAASAARLNLIPTWLIHIVHPRTSAPTRGSAHLAQPKPHAATPTSMAEGPSPSPAKVGAPAELGTGTPTTNATTESTAPAPANRLEVQAPTSTRRVALTERDERFRPPTLSRLSNASVPSRVAPEFPFANRVPNAMATHEHSEFAPDPGPSPPVVAAPVSSPLPPVANLTKALTPESTASAASPPQAQAQGNAGHYLIEAIRSLRIEHAPTSALRLLDSHDGELMKEGFGHEALILRVEALIALGRRAEVLRLLDGTSLTSVAAWQSLLVRRGELRAAANRCAEGIDDFDLVLDRSHQTDRQALIGRALCRKQLGDIAGMHADVERLRKEFPEQALPGELGK